MTPDGHIGDPYRDHPLTLDGVRINSTPSRYGGMGVYSDSVCIVFGKLFLQSGDFIIGHTALAQIIDGACREIGIPQL